MINFGDFEDQFVELSDLLGYKHMTLRIEMQECRTCTKYFIEYLDERDNLWYSRVLDRDDLYYLQEKKRNGHRN